MLGVVLLFYSLNGAYCVSTDFSGDVGNWFRSLYEFLLADFCSPCCYLEQPAIICRGNEAAGVVKKVLSFLFYTRYASPYDLLLLDERNWHSAFYRKKGIYSIPCNCW